MQKEAALERGVPGRTRRRPARWRPLGVGLLAPPWPSPHGWAQAPALSPQGCALSLFAELPGRCLLSWVSLAT